MEPNIRGDASRAAMERMTAMRKLPWDESNAWIKEHAGVWVWAGVCVCVSVSVNVYGWVGVQGWQRIDQ